MMIFLDSNYCCHLDDDGNMRSVETDFFNGKCKSFVEGYRFVPLGEKWVRHDGIVFSGEMITAAEDYTLLDIVQKQYEEDESIHLTELGALIEEIYNEDLEVIG